MFNSKVGASIETFALSIETLMPSIETCVRSIKSSVNQNAKWVLPIEPCINFNILGLNSKGFTEKSM